MAWKAVEVDHSDPQRHFSFAFEHLRQRCMDLQPRLKPLDRFRRMLQEELQSLTLELETEESEESIQD